ncbi:MAG: hypothetical protein IPM46_13045 [Flavobacteriales bacterium]|nr:hypothetical protein [Flavobacteriales bacterium]
MAPDPRNPILRFMVYAHVLLALGAAAQVHWIGEQWFGKADWRMPASAFFATFACYGLLRLVRSREKGLKHVPLFTWYNAHLKAMMIAVGASMVLAIAVLGPEAWGTITRTWPVILPAFLYVVPLRRNDGRLLGLRRIPALKSFLVAWVWAAGTVLLAAEEVDGMAWLLVMVFFCFYLAIAIAFDLRDAQMDPPGLRTMPQLFGPKAAKAIAVLFLTPMVWLLVVQNALDISGDYDGSLLPLVGLGLALLIIIRSSPQRGWLHWLLLDACIGLLPLLAWVSGGL